MSLSENDNMIMPVSPMYGNGGGFGGFGNDGAWWLLILLFALGGNWGGYGNGGNGAQIQNDISRGFDNAATTAQLSNIQGSIADMAMAQQNCCCENRTAIADLKYAIATESAANRFATSDGVRDIIANQTASTQAILDKLCQQEIDALKTQVSNLQTELNMANLAASQNAQTGQILNDNARQTTVLEQYLNPAPIPAYVVQNPNCCTQNNGGCGCGCGGF